MFRRVSLFDDMGIFSKKKSLIDTGIFQEFTDWHSHILPGVDDGAMNLGDALSILEAFESMGIRKVWLTPHIMEDFPNETSYLRERFKELKEAWKGNVEIMLASENMLDNLFEERLEKGDLLPIGEDGRHLLVETSYYNPPYAMEEMMEKALSKGYYLILAHPERYRYMNEEDYIKFKEKGILFQMNLLSLTGHYGETAGKKAEWLLSKHFIDIAGTDIHRLENFKTSVKRPCIKKGFQEKIGEIITSRL